MSKVIHSVEVLFIDGTDVPVEHKSGDHFVVLRDALDPGGDALYFSADEWEAFILGAKDGEFDEIEI
ncbi:DUF397 domain-containing protein [Actinoallomurus acaciae]|uniref:DUF397 domain-containing protein n=1 Tax=Actinoallomurus acaciae TaxID=502577 RepID=A0ABV5Y8X6_9ACTN